MSRKVEEMNTKNIEPFKLHIEFELAYEIISYSILMIFIGIAFVFGSNLLTFNWYSLIFAIFALFMIYLKRKSYIVIEDNKLCVYYMKYIDIIHLDMNDIKEFIFYEQGRRVNIKIKTDKLIPIHLSDKNKQKLLDLLVSNYPNIPCLFLKHTR